MNSSTRILSLLNTNDYRFFGYKHWTLEDQPRCFYVGRGLVNRPSSLIGRNHKWHAIVKRYGLRVEVCVGPITHLEAVDWEIKTIEKMKTFTTCHSCDDSNDIGCNLTKGGEGTIGWHPTDETKRKISLAQKGEKSSWFGRKHSDSTKEKISASNTGKLRGTKSRIAISTRLVGKPVVNRGDNWRMKIGESNKRRKGIRLFSAMRIRKFNHVSDQLILLCGGPDRCGKTNILRELERRTNIPYFKASSEHQNFIASQDKFINELRYADPRIADMMYQLGFSALVDRAYMCEWVYSQYYNRETDMRMLRTMDNAYKKLDALILICTRKSFVGIKDDLDPTLDEVALQKISDLYQDFTRWTKCTTHTLYVDDEDLDRELSEILSWLRDEGRVT